MIPTFRFSNETAKSHYSNCSCDNRRIGQERTDLSPSSDSSSTTVQQQLVSDKKLVQDARSLRISEKCSSSEAEDTFRRARNLAAFDSLPQLHKLYDSKRKDKKANIQENNCTENQSIQKRNEVMDEVEFHHLILKSYNQDKEYGTDEQLKDQPIGKEIETFLDKYEEEVAMTKKEDDVEGECFGRDRSGSIGSLSTSWNSRCSEQQSRLGRPIKESTSMTSPAIIMTTTAQQAYEKVQCERNEDVHKGILRNSRIYRRSLSNKSLNDK